MPNVPLLTNYKNILTIYTGMELLQWACMFHGNTVGGGQHLADERFGIVNGGAAQNAPIAGQIHGVNGQSFLVGGTADDEHDHLLRRSPER